MTNLQTAYDEIFSLNPTQNVDEPYGKVREDKQVLQSLDHYLTKLAQLNEPIVYFYKRTSQKDEIKHQLQITQILLHAQQIDYQKRGQTFNAKSLNDDIKKCSDLLNILNDTHDFNAYAPKAAPEMPVSYLALLLGLEMRGIWTHFSKQAQDAIQSGRKAWEAFYAAKMDTLIKWINDLNERRLNWVWTGRAGLLGVICDMVLKPDFFHAAKANQTLKSMRPFETYLSFILYYIRLGANALGLAGYTLQAEDKKAEFLIQLDERKFPMLNDIVWASGNMACALWLVGPGVLGPTGDVLTLVLLGFDIMLNIWQFAESEYRFRKRWYALQKEYNQLEVNNTAYGISRKKDILEEQTELVYQQWINRSINLNNLAYALALFAAFAMLAAPFMPLPAGALFAVIVTGAALCFTTTLIYNGVGVGLKAAKAVPPWWRARKELHDKKIQLLASRDGNEQGLVYLQIRRLEAEQRYQQRQFLYQTLTMLRSTITDVLFPACVLVGMVFMPFGLGIAVIAIAAALILPVKLIIDKAFCPKQEDLPEFDEKECKNYLNQLTEKYQPG